jgi:hypothetical protein
MRLIPHLSTARGYDGIAPAPTSFRCPVCGHDAAFERLDNINDLHLRADGRRTGLRMCPRPQCRAVVYLVFDEQGEILLTEPRLTIDFDASNVPDAIRDTFEEALVCHANACHVAAGIMVRKTLEVLCDHEGVTSGGLRGRVAELRSKVTLPPALLEGLEELRLLGNDAAHLEARVYEEIGPAEIELAIDIAKEIIKSLYQTQTLLSRLQALKAPPATT